MLIIKAKINTIFFTIRERIVFWLIMFFINSITFILVCYNQRSIERIKEHNKLVSLHFAEKEFPNMLYLP